MDIGTLLNEIQAIARNGLHFASDSYDRERHKRLLALSHEGSALKYWRLEDVPHWHPNHNKYAFAAREMWRSDTLLPAISD